MPELNGIEAARQIPRANQPDVRVVMLSACTKTSNTSSNRSKPTPNGYVLKGSAFQELLLAINTAMSGKSYISPALSTTLMDDYVRRAQGDQKDTEVSKLSGRERAKYCSSSPEGKSSAEVAELLHISVRTVDTHRHNLMSKLEIHSIAGLTKFAIRHGLCISELSRSNDQPSVQTLQQRPDSFSEYSKTRISRAHFQI